MTWIGLSINLFIKDDRLRPIGRFFLSLGLLVTAYFLTAGIVGTGFLVAKVHPSFVMVAFWQSLVGLAAIMGALKLMTAVFEQRPLGSVGLAFHPRWWRELGGGLAVGAAMLFLVIVPEWGCGFARFTYTPHSMLRVGFFSFVFFAAAATNEEAIFRGYPFQRLAESFTPVGAIALMSGFFGLVHLPNPHRTWLSTLNTALMGIPFAIAYLRTRSLWMPIGMHFIWNFLMGFFLGLPVSGYTVPASVLTARVQGPNWLTGGEYGPEGGLLATGAILVAIAYLSFTKSIYTTGEMKALVFAPVTARWSDPPLTIFSSPPGKMRKATNSHVCQAF